MNGKVGTVTPNKDGSATAVCSTCAAEDEVWEYTSSVAGEPAKKLLAHDSEEHATPTVIYREPEVNGL